VPRESTLVVAATIMRASKCTAGGMIAYAEDDREIALNDAPLRVGDRWVIDVTSPRSTPVSTGGG
jgi:hypothetical protein